MASHLQCLPDAPSRTPQSAPDAPSTGHGGRRLAHVAHYQAGAFVALYVCARAADIRKVTLGGLVYDEGLVTEDSVWRLGGSEEAIVVALGALFSGLAAEARFDASRDPLATMPAEDAESLRKWLAMMARSHPGVDHAEWLTARAHDLIDEHWAAVVQLARDLEVRGSLERSDAELIIEASKGCEPARSVLRLRKATAVTIRVA